MRKILSFLCIIALVVGSSAADVHAKKKSNDNPKYASLVMDASTGMILSQRYADKVLHPASLTKIMTLLLAFEALDRGTVTKRTRVRISKHAASMVPSKLGLKPGTSIQLEDAIYSLVTKSANDVAVALAERLGGSERKFAQLMTERARTIGMTKTRFRNASGLPDKYQVTTARDMAKMARYILQRYPHYYRYFSTKNFTYKGVSYRNHNRLLGTYKGMDGFKTGYINASGFNLVASAHRDGRRLIGIVFGGRSGASRNTHMAEILDAGFKKAKTTRVAYVQKPPKPKPNPRYVQTSMAATQAQRDQIALTSMAKNTSGVVTTNKPSQAPASFTSLASLESKTKIITRPSTVTSTSNVNSNRTDSVASAPAPQVRARSTANTSMSKRIETGLMAIAAHKGEYRPDAPQRNTKTAALSTLPHPKDVVGKWSVQIGAFNDRNATDNALRTAYAKLPNALTNVSLMSVPLRTDKGLIFRARLGGMSEQEARAACNYFPDCLPIAPTSTKVSTQ